MGSLSEKQLQTAILVRLSEEPDVVLWRNNSGLADFGTHKVRYGLGVGGADLIGMASGRFIALEVKAAKGRVSEQQSAFLDAVRRFGGVAEVVRSVEDALAVVEEARNASQSAPMGR